MPIFNNVNKIEPGSDVRIITDSSASPNIISTGIVGVIGESVGGLTYEDNAVYAGTQPNQLKDILKGGVSSKVINFIFNPSPDNNGANRVYFVRAQKATKASATIVQVTGGAVTSVITSVDKGAYLSDATDGLMWKLVAGTVDTDKNVLMIQLYQEIIWSSPEVNTFKELVDAVVASDVASKYITFAVTVGTDTTPIDDSIRTASFAVLTGGTSPAMTGADVDGALAELTNINVNIIFVASEDAANHLKALSYCNNTAELPCVTYVGGAASETKAQVEARALALNSENAVIAYPDITVTKNDNTGTEDLSPMYHAAMLAGLRAGSPSYTPLTYKRLNVIAFKPSEGELDKTSREELITKGVTYSRNIPGVGLAVNRGVNTLQNAGSILYKKPDGTAVSPEDSIMAIIRQVITELKLGSAPLFIGGTVATVSQVDIVNFVSTYLRSKTSTTVQPNLLIDFGNVSAELSDDAWISYFDMTVNTPVNYIFHIGTVLKP